MNKKLLPSCKKIWSILLFTLFLSSTMTTAASAGETSTSNYADRYNIMSAASITNDADLQMAIVNANPGDTIVLTEDLTLTGTVVINKSITINGAGHTLSLAEDNANRHFNITGRSDVVFENLTIKGHGSTTTGGGIFISGATLDIIGSTITDNVSAADGGGIYAFGGSDIKITNGSRIINNTAMDGYGGGIYALNDSSLNISGGSIISGNVAQLDGGGIYTSDLTKLTTDNVTFEGNSARTDYPWTIDIDSTDPVIKAASELHQSNILNTIYTAAFTNAYNNFDIYYDGTNLPVTTAEVTVNYYMDTIEEDNLLDSISFTASIGETLDEANFAEILGDDWVNANKPEGYGNGQLQISLPLTIETEEVTVDILYTEIEVPKTGDNSSLWSYILLSLSAMAGMFFIIKRRSTLRVFRMSKNRGHE